MRFIHTGDLHIGITINGFNMIEDQDYILSRIISIAKEEQADAVLLAGDLYDRSVPSAEAVKLLDFFITELVKNNIYIMAISGNHDSPERLSFASSIMRENGFFIEGIFNGEMKSVTLNDEFGDVNFYMLPYFRDIKEESMETAVRNVIEKANIDEKKRNVILSHNFVTTDGRFNEEIVGNVDNVDVSVFEKFDYAALGHIHSSMHIGSGNVYYSGSPLKYSFSKMEKSKCIHLIDIKEKGDIEITPKNLVPIREMRKIKGELKELIKDEIVSLGNPNDFICATLTNKEELIDPIGTLRMVYPNIMQVIIEKNILNNHIEKIDTNEIKSKTPLELFEEFYLFVTETSLEEEKKDIVKQFIEKAKRGEKS